jgi:CRISPR-associated protein Csm4
VPTGEDSPLFTRHHHRLEKRNIRMNLIRLTITPRTAFGTRPMGDTLFGQLCWALRNRHGENRLVECLQGYTEGRPYAVVSDAFPGGHLPRPALPNHWFAAVEGAERKAMKKRVWLPREALATPVENWLNVCKSAADIPGAEPHSRPQPHNSINRATGTTGTGQFAPYSMSQLWYGTKKSGSDVTTSLDIYVVLDEARLSREELTRLFQDMGDFGFGRDASIGLGKFELSRIEPDALPDQADANAWLTLAPSAPQGLELDAERSFYQTFTRFGRHGDIGVHLGNPFKTPVLLAQTGAVLTPKRFHPAPFVGRGLGGNGQLTKIESLKGTVHQGYAPAVGIRLLERKAA